MNYAEITYKKLPLEVAFDYTSADLDSCEDLSIVKVTLDGRQVDLLLSDEDYENIINLLYKERAELQRQSTAEYYGQHANMYYGEEYYI